MNDGKGGSWEDIPELFDGQRKTYAEVFADNRTPLRLQQEQILADMAKKRAAGTPVIIGTDVEATVGHVFFFWIAMRIVRVSTRAEYQFYSESDVQEMRVPYFYEVEAMD